MSRNQEPSALNSKKGALMVASAAALWGTFSLFFRPAQRMVEERGGHLSAATESFVFFGVVFLILAPRSLSRQTLSPPTARAWAWMALFSIADALNLLLYFGAMHRTTVAIAVLSHYLQPVIVAVLSPWVMQEARRRGVGWTATLAVVGLALLLEPHTLFDPTSADDTSQPILGAAMGAGSAVLFAAVMFSIKKLGSWFSSNQILTLHSPGALLILYLFVPPGELDMGIDAWVILILAGLLPGTLGGYLFVEGVRHLPPSRAGILTLLEPVVALIIGVVFWHERPGLVALLGAMIILFSAYRVLKESN